MAGVSAASLIGGGIAVATLGALTGSAIGASAASSDPKDGKGNDAVKGGGIFAVGAVGAGVGLGGATWAAMDVADAMSAAGRSSVLTRAATWGTFAAGTAALLVPAIGAGTLVHRALD